ncbi:MAG: hypothetical protein ACO1NM_06110 [Sphingobium phenoxybenzoativorans]
MSWRMLEARGRALCVRAAARRRAAIARAVAQEAPGVAAMVEGDDVVLEGRGLMRRWLGDLGLRDAAGGGR